MNRLVLALLSISTCVSCWGQLTPGQKAEDLQTLASLYAKQYAPVTWKMQAFDYNLFKLAPWLDLVQQTTDDIGFYEVMAEYVASLNDAHSVYQNPSDFEAELGFSTDIYEGKVLIDSIDRSALPATKFKFQIGDELVMVDNKTVEEYIQEFPKFFSDANPGSTSRDAASLIPLRIQAFYPRAEEVGSTATVVIRRQKGNLETYMIRWVKSGTPLTKIGPTKFPQIAGRPSRRAAPTTKPAARNDYRSAVVYLQKMRLPTPKNVLNFAALQPVFNLPAGFTQRLGGNFDFFFTGTFVSGVKTIGYIRIPDFELFGDYSSFVDAADSSFDDEIAYMQANTSGLVVDVMRNPGGYGCYAEDLMSRLATSQFHDLNAELRPTILEVQAFQQMVDGASTDGSPKLRGCGAAAAVEECHEGLPTRRINGSDPAVPNQLQAFTQQGFAWKAGGVYEADPAADGRIQRFRRGPVRLNVPGCQAREELRHADDGGGGIGGGRKSGGLLLGRICVGDKQLADSRESDCDRRISDGAAD